MTIDEKIFIAADTVQEMVDRDATAKELMTVLMTMLPAEEDALGRLMEVLPQDAGAKVIGAVLERMADDGKIIRCGDGHYMLAPRMQN